MVEAEVRSVNIRDYYERYWSDTGSGFHGRMNAELGELLLTLTLPQSDCLDVGCGDGRTTGTWLAGRAGSYVGVDVSASAVAQAQELGLDARLIDDAADLPFADESFDFVSCIEVFEHLFDAEGAAAEIVRVLRPGGRILAQVPNVAHWRHRADFALRGRFNPIGDAESLMRTWRDPHIRFFTVHTLPRMLESVGLEIEQVSGLGVNAMCDLPLARRYARHRRPGPLMQRLVRIGPALFGARIRVIARRP
jgi:methionine biosynthesis protein MetW